MSPLGEEKQYKSGMRKDPDGFMDIEWCSSKVSCSGTGCRCAQFTVRVLQHIVLAVNSMVHVQSFISCAS
jgi:hypothetical protein